jgi:hypothetical protein
MDARTAEALEKSIEHWREICDAPMIDIDIGPSICALCRVFHAFFTRSVCVDCIGCPVFAATKQTLCDGSPFPEAQAAYDAWWRADEDEDEAAMQEAEAAFRTAARAELAFLESLREPVKET